MSSITYGAAAPAVTPVPARKSLFARFLDALVESRMRKAEEEIRRVRHLWSDQHAFVPLNSEQGRSRSGGNGSCHEAPPP